MAKGAEDKAERILFIYSKLKQGKVIYKEEESTHYRVSSRTIQRDIADIQNFLGNQGIETGDIEKIVYDKNQGGYVLHTKYKKQMEAKEVLVAAKVLLESRALMKSELFPIIHKMLDFDKNEPEMKMVEDLLRNEMHHYVELHHGKLLLDRLWELEKAVKTQRYIEIRYKKLKKQEIVVRRVKPVGIMFSEFYFYLTAYIDGIDKKEEFQNQNDTYPTIYRVDRLLAVKVLEEHFSIPYAERFEEGEFRKRIQFMFGGELQKVWIKCKEESLESVLDRLPTARIVRKEKDGYVVLAEVFGDGVDMWLRSQGEKVKFLKARGGDSG